MQQLLTQMAVMQQQLLKQSQQLTTLQRENDELRRKLRSAHNKRSRSMDDAARPVASGELDSEGEDIAMDDDTVVADAGVELEGQGASRHVCN
jgi:septal ring factor EnvC (AmiA/AmiB activator)